MTVGLGRVSLNFARTVCSPTTLSAILGMQQAQQPQ